MWAHGERIAALLIALFGVIAPAVQIGFLLVILFSVRRPPAPRWVGTLLRWVEIAGAWSMVEVMLLGILVSLVKIAALARVIPASGSSRPAGSSCCSRRCRPASIHARPGRGSAGRTVKDRNARPLPRGWMRRRRGDDRCRADRSARRARLVRGVRPPVPSGRRGGTGECPRCGEVLEFRRRDAIQRTWALVIAAAICYLPANILR